MTEEIQTLASLEFFPYIDSEGKLPEFVQGKIGVCAIFDSEKVLQFVDILAISILASNNI